jgi:flavin reductase (DIM6/NTAB) family NADH-FMN oxidoreductase RutF
MQTVALPVKPGFGENSVIFGEVVGIHISDSVIEDGMIDITKMRTIARCGYHDYTVVDSVFSMTRPSS